MPQRGFLSPAEVRAVDAWVKEHAQGEDLCPVSSENDWITMDEVLFMPKFISKSEGSSGEGKQKEPSKSIPLVIQFCRGCGYSRTFGAMKIGLWPQD